MTIYVRGNCQATSIAACLSLMNPGIRVERLRTNAESPALASDDIVFRQHRPPLPPVGERHANEVLYPSVAFNAFFPDVVTIADPSGTARLPMGGRQSSLVLYAWSCGMTPQQTAKLFCEPVFEKLGFFNWWEASARILLEQGRAIGFPLDGMLASWSRRGRFMHSPEHPVLWAMADVARELMARAGLRSAFDSPEEYLPDPGLTQAIWPVYPEIAQRLGVPGSYAFKAAHSPSQPVPVVMDLDEFIRNSFDAFAHAGADALFCTRLQAAPYRDLESMLRATRVEPRAVAAERPPANARSRPESPYRDLPARQFWRRAVEQVAVRDVDPARDAPFTIDRRTRIATAGSCFAQHMSRELQRAGYTYFVAEQPPPSLSADDARTAGYGIFSTRSGNVYTGRQLLQLFDRAYGAFVPQERAWLRPDGRFADPFRAQIEPAGFGSVDELLAAQERHLAAVRTMFEQLDVLIFTLGLTEAWRSSSDGAVFSSAPGVVAGRLDAARHEFVNFTAADVRDDVGAFFQRLKGVNPAAKMVLTVSPVPLIATYEPRHVVASTTYSKAALRAAADEVERGHSDVWYFASYELVAGSHNRGTYFEPDGRTVTAAGVGHVLRLFFAHAANGEPMSPATDALVADEALALMGVVCDEDVVADDEPRADSPGGFAGMDPLAPSSMRAALEGILPCSMTAGTVAIVPCTVGNAGDIALVTAGNHAVYACYRWYDEAGHVTEVGNSIHTPLPGSVEPGASVALALRVAAPRYAGRYRLRAALLQSNVAWFDDVDPSNGLEAVVDVSERPVSKPSAAPRDIDRRLQ